MYLVQILLPLNDNTGKQFGNEIFDRIRIDLTERFGGLTAFIRAPATGLWKNTPGSTMCDEIVIYEVMVESVDRFWWNEYRERLRNLFQQHKLIIRAESIELL